MRNIQLLYPSSPSRRPIRCPRLPFPPEGEGQTLTLDTMFSHDGKNWAMPSGAFAGINWLWHDSSLTALKRRWNVERERLMKMICGTLFSPRGGIRTRPGSNGAELTPLS